MKEREFAAKLDETENVIDFINSILEQEDCPPKVCIAFSVAVDELFSNIARYAYPDSEGYALVSCAVTDNTAIVRFSDRGIAYNPLSKEDPDITLSAEERSIGGLGIFMVKKSMDDISYEYKDGKNVLTIKKGF